MYDPGSQYTASLDQTHNQWRLQPADGQDLVIDIGDCATGAMVPSGFWLLVSDSRASPSCWRPRSPACPPATRTGLSCAACDKAHGRQLAVPQILLDCAVERNTGAIYVDN